MRQQPSPTVTGTAVVTPFSAVNVDVEIWGQSGSQIMGCVGMGRGAVPVGMGGGVGSGGEAKSAEGVGFRGVVEGKAKETPEAREGIVVLDLWLDLDLEVEVVSGPSSASSSELEVAGLVDLGL